MYMCSRNTYIKIEHCEKNRKIAPFKHRPRIYNDCVIGKKPRYKMNMLKIEGILLI